VLKKCGLVVILLFLFTAVTVNAQSLNLGIKGLGGFAGGSTDDSTKDGQLGFTTGGGLKLDFYFAQVKNTKIGVSSGVEYTFLSYESESDTVVPLVPVPTLATDTNYSYLTLPFTVKGAFSLNDTIALTLDVGTFFGIFLDGKSDNTFNPEVVFLGLTNGEEDLNSDTTERLDFGLRFAAGLDMNIGKKALFSPGVQFDLGLTDTSKDQPIVASSKDTFWKLTAFVGVGYRLF
jgi:hypothetical protein